MKVFKVLGAFEIPVVTQALAKLGKYEAIICLGAVIRGETPHFDYICEQVAAGGIKFPLDQGIPCIFGVLTTDNLQQAQERSSEIVGNKGCDAAQCALDMVQLLNRIEAEH